MAYMGQERKKQIEPVVKAICKRYGVKATMAVRHHMTLVLNVSAGAVDFAACDVLPARNHGEEKLPRTSWDVNHHAPDHQFTGPALAFVREVIAAMNDGNHDNSDLVTDYYDVGWYIDVNIGRWDRPYLFTGAAPVAPAISPTAIEVQA